jgi:4-hydroxybenzoate polyprenyltransferase
MFLNDACDAVFDRQYRRERPIPSGHITRRAVWWWGMAWLVAGAATLFFISRTTGLLGLVLLFCILLYDVTHKHVSFAPVLMASCRFVLYLTAASSASEHVNGWAIWCGIAMAAYILGLSFLARFESIEGPLRFWPMVILAAPIVLALIMNSGPYRHGAALLSLVLGLWCLKSLRYTLAVEDRDLGRTVSGLLAGIVFVDWLSVADAPKHLGIAFLILFGLALLFQKFVPAT